MKKFWNVVKPLLAQVFTSKKALATMAGVVVALLGKLGVTLPLEMTVSILGLIGAYVIGQGIADNGKEAVKAELAVDQAMLRDK